MAVLSGLALGETLRIRENGEFQDFTVIARGTHGTNEADTLVIRRDLLAPCTYFFASAEYEGSTPDRWLSYGYLNTLQDSVRVNLVPASLPCWDEFHKEQKTLVRRCFLLSATELGFVDESRVPVEGTAIPYFANDAARVAQLAGEYGTERILIGLPRKLDFSEGAQAEHSRAFGDKLAEMGFSVRYEDERLTTAMAQRALLEGDASRKRRKQVVDKIAAVLILQGFLDAGGWPEEDKEDTAMDGEMERDDIVELYDEDDNLVRFEHVMTIEYEGENYVLLAPLDEDEEGDEVIILRIEEQDGEEVYATLEDDDLINAVFSRYLEIVEEEDEDEN